MKAVDLMAQGDRTAISHCKVVNTSERAQGANELTLMQPFTDQIKVSVSGSTISFNTLDILLIFGYKKINILSDTRCFLAA
ncbi:hypothetical protein [Ruegeria sp.]|uniref:hypothetical protein n=1 Tax=Ruegeria sp. TaxID=1879320 RepID=UPI003C7A467C